MIVVGKVKNWVCLMVAKKLKYINYSTLNTNNNAGKMMNLIGSDIELF